jgi:hypothetical protein
MLEFNAVLTQSFNIQFKDPEKAEQFFVHGDWGDCFYDVDSLKELIEVMSTIIATELESPSWNIDKETHQLDLEGFPNLVYNSELKVYETNNDKGDEDLCGKIIVTNLYPFDIDCVIEV